MTLLHLDIFQGLFVVLLHPPALLKLKETGQFVPPSQYFALPSLPSNSSGLLSIMISERLYVLCSENPPCFLLLGNPLPAAIEEMCGGGKRWDSEDEWLWPSNR